MTKIYVLALLLLILSRSCINTTTALEESPLQDFEAVPEIKLNSIKITLEHDSVLYDPRTINVFDSIAVFYDISGVAGFSMVNLLNGKLITRFAHIGDDENYDINTLSLSPIKGSTKEFSIYEGAPPYRVFKYNIDSLINSKTYSPELVCQLPKEVVFETPLVESDSVILGNITFTKLDNKFFGIYNLRQKTVTTGIDVPKFSSRRYKQYYQDENISWVKAVLGSNIGIRPNGREIASFSKRGGLFQIISIENHKPKVLTEKLYYMPEFVINEISENITKSMYTKNNKYGYNNITVTEDRIYALYNGKLTNTPGVESLSSNLVLVYDWAGKPINKILLDDEYYQIAIDPQQLSTSPN
ncbi:TolB-like 6-blade propeller-like [Parapedobacter luteus]|uniref:TolB-like 6-blade propeller-like n=2 Tax=Parapedobacter luteus TaxID=623280 RepID=A0A1T5FTF8_9SPHI|nr:TolB-like 6-blade propeller-like [Parapedobacter luteus]